MTKYADANGQKLIQYQKNKSHHSIHLSNSLTLAVCLNPPHNPANSSSHSYLSKNSSRLKSFFKPTTKKQEKIIPMAEYRSKSYSYTHENMQIEPYYGPPSSTRPNEFRSYSVSYDSSNTNDWAGPPPQQLKKGKSTSGSTSNSWGLNDPEFQRKRRVASYKVYSVEGKVKGSFRKSFRWLKDKYSQMVYGWR